MKVAALFPGYGSQFVGMAKELYDDSRLVQEHFEQASNCLDINFVKLCFASSDIELARMNNAYTALFLVSSSIFDLIKQEGVEADVVAGYSCGQYSALHAAGSLSLPDGLYLLNKYVTMYEALIDKGEFGFAKVFNISSEQLEYLCKKYNKEKTPVGISIYDSPMEHVIAGDAKTVEQVCHDAVDLEGTTEIIGYELGLHSSLMDEIESSFKMYLEKVDFKDGEASLLCSSDAKKIRVGKDLQQCAISWITKPILWSQTVDKLKEYDLLIAIGPGMQLHDMLKQRYPEKQVVAVNNISDIEKLKDTLGITAKAEK